MAGQRQAAKDVTHALVLAAARTLFTTKGYEAVHMREVAAACGRSTGSIFSNFPSKEALFAAAMGRPAPDVKAYLRRAVELGPHAPLMEMSSEAHRLLGDLYGPNW